MFITSTANPRIKDARALKLGKHRRASGRCLVEGIHHVGQVAEAGLIESVFYSPELLTSEFALGLIDSLSEQGIPCHPVSRPIIEQFSERSGPQGIAAVAYTPFIALEALEPRAFPMVVALTSAQNPGHVGTIIRTIDAVGASALILLDGGTDPYHPRSVRASMGTVFWVPVVETSWKAFAAWIQACGYHVYGTSARAETDYRRVGRYGQPCVLLLGSEREGLRPEQVDLCDEVVRIPMCNRASSLSLSVAAGIMLYEMLGTG